MKKTHDECIPQVGQQKHKLLFTNVIFVCFHLWRLQWLSKLVSRHQYDLFIFRISQYLFADEIHAHNIICGASFRF